LRSFEDAKRKTLRSVEWLNFFLADVQTGLGPFLAACLASSGWSPARVGYALTFGGLITVAAQTPAGAAVDAVHRKRLLVAINLGVLVCAAFLLMGRLSVPSVYAAQVLIGGAAPFLGPAVVAMTLGITGAKAFDRQFGKNQTFNSAGNVFTALLVAYVGYKLGIRAVFAVPVAMSIPALLCLIAIDGRQINYAEARGAGTGNRGEKVEAPGGLLKDRALVCFLACAFLFHLANAAMLPELGELLSKDKPREAAPFMAACVIVTQLVISVSATWLGKRAALIGRKPLLLVGFGLLPVRGVLYTLTQTTWALVAIQVLDGMANAIFAIVSILVIKDRTQGTGRFNLAAGAMATMVGIGAALSNTLGGLIVEHLGYSASFLGLAAIASLAFFLLAATVPETLPARRHTRSGQLDAIT
jgi:MFS family permease